jgi:hypothetical protein
VAQGRKIYCGTGMQNILRRRLQNIFRLIRVRSTRNYIIPFIRSPFMLGCNRRKEQHQ